jgi:hypothetical protein
MFAEPPRWAVVPAAPAYQVSDYGDVRRLLGDGSTRPIRPARNDAGYLKVSLGWAPCEPGCTRHGRRPAARRRGHLLQGYVHRLMWEAFRGPIPDGLTINHRDGRQRHNRLSNFELMTRGDNTRDAWARWRGLTDAA